jgi:ketosteroid isomerase-like protein
MVFCDVYQIQDGKITSLRSYFDSATLMAQLGLMG